MKLEIQPNAQGQEKRKQYHQRVQHKDEPTRYYIYIPNQFCCLKKY